MRKLSIKQRAALNAMKDGAALVCSTSHGTNEANWFVESRPMLSVHGSTAYGLERRGLIVNVGRGGQTSVLFEITEAGRKAIT